MIFKITIAIVFFIFLCSKGYAQNNCECKGDYGTIRCDTTKVGDVGLLIQSCDADSIYYHLIVFKSKKKLKITSVEMMYLPYIYRLGAVVEKQSKSCIKFKFGCTATGDLCLYKVYNIKTGKLYSTDK